MPDRAQIPESILAMISRVASTMVIAASAVALTVLLSPIGQAQTYKNIYKFRGGNDGADPESTVVMDATGSLYGSTREGGSKQGWCSGYGGCGTVFRLRPNGSNWNFETLYLFSAIEGGFGEGGEDTATQVVIGTDGTPYGTTEYGGPVTSPWRVGYGTVINIRPSGPWGWTETTIHSFNGTDGQWPGFQRLMFDAYGNIYGTASSTVYKLKRSGGQWTESVLYNVPNSPSGVIMDSAGNLYGTTEYGGSGGRGSAFQLAPSNNGWTFRDLYDFRAPYDQQPMTGLISDSSGNLYGTTTPSVYDNGGGSVFMLTPSGGDWNYTLLHVFNHNEVTWAGLAIDTAGNLYGTTRGGAGGCGSVYKLTPGSKGWTYTTVYQFTGAGDEGCDPYSSGVIVDGKGNIFGTTFSGGNPSGCQFGSCGVIFEITQ